LADQKNRNSSSSSLPEVPRQGCPWRASFLCSWTFVSYWLHRPSDILCAAAILTGTAQILPEVAAILVEVLSISRKVAQLVVAAVCTDVAAICTDGVAVCTDVASMPVAKARYAAVRDGQEKRPESAGEHDCSETILLSHNNPP